MKEFKRRFGRYVAMLLAFAMVSNTLFTTQAMASVLVTEDVIEEDVEDVSAEEYATYVTTGNDNALSGDDGTIWGGTKGIFTLVNGSSTNYGTSDATIELPNGEEKTVNRYFKFGGTSSKTNGRLIKFHPNSTGKLYVYAATGSTGTERFIKLMDEDGNQIGTQASTGTDASKPKKIIFDINTADVDYSVGSYNSGNSVWYIEFVPVASKTWDFTTDEFKNADKTVSYDGILVEAEGTETWGYTNTTYGSNLCRVTLKVPMENPGIMTLGLGYEWDIKVPEGAYVSSSGFTKTFKEEIPNNAGTGTVVYAVNPTGGYVTLVADKDIRTYLKSIKVEEGEAKTGHSITCEDSSNGKISSNVAKAVKDATVTITGVPETDYALQKIDVTGVGEVEATDNEATFTMPEGNVNVTATFVDTTIVPRWSVSANGVKISRDADTIDEDGLIDVDPSTPIYVKVDVPEGKIIDKVLYTADGKDAVECEPVAGKEGIYTFTTPSTMVDSTIEVSCEVIDKKVVVNFSDVVIPADVNISKCTTKYPVDANGIITIIGGKDESIQSTATGDDDSVYTKRFCFGGYPQAHNADASKDKDGRNIIIDLGSHRANVRLIASVTGCNASSSGNLFEVQVGKHTNDNLTAPISGAARFELAPSNAFDEVYGDSEKPTTVTSRPCNQIGIQTVDFTLEAGKYQLYSNKSSANIYAIEVEFDPESDVTSATVTYDYNDGKDTKVVNKNVAVGKTIVCPTILTDQKPGSEFLGWCKDSECTIDWDFENDVIEGNTTIYAKWASNKYTVSFELNGGEGSIASQTVPENGLAIEPAAPKRTGYTFEGWTLDGAKYDFATSVTKNITLVAQWKINEYKVTFDTNGGSAIASQTVSYNSCPKAVTGPTKVGHTFDGWTVSGNMIPDITTYNVKDDTTFVAAWAVNNYTVSFNSLLVTIDTQTVSYNGYPKAVTDPTEEGFRFVGWTLDDEIIDDITTVQITEDTTFIAKWAKVYNVETASVEHATITVDPSEAVLNEEVTVTVTPDEGYYVKSISANAIIASYDESEVSEEKTETFNMPASDVTVSAVINAIAYTPEIDATRATVSCNKVKYVANEDVTFTADSVSGNVIYSVEVKAKKADAVVPTTKDGDNYLFKMPAGGAVIVVKAGPVITVSENELVASVTFGEGIVTVSGNEVLANDKTTATITLTAEATASNSAVKKVVLVDINGKEYEATAAGEGKWNVFQPEVEAELIITVEKQYKLSVSENALSNVKVLNDKAESAIGNNFENTAFKITVEPVNDGTYVKSVSANEVELYKVAAPVSSAVKKGATVEIDTYTMPANDVVISTEVAYIDYNVETVSEKATVSVNAIGKSVHVNDEIEFTVVPDEDCEVYSVVVYNEYDKEEIEPTLVDGVYSFNMPASNVTITAKADKLYTIATDVSENGSVSINAVAVKPGKYTAGTDVKVVTTPNKGFRVERNAKNLPIIKVAGKEVEGTTRDANEFSFEMPESNVTVSVNFVAIPQWTVSFNVLGETKKSVTVDDETSVNEEDAPSVSVENYEFGGWMLNGEAYDFTKEVTSNITLDAKLTRTYTVTFDVDGTVSSNKVVSGNKVTKPADPTKTGYEFAGWTLEGEAYDFNTAVTSDITLVATWTIKKFTVTFDTNGGSTIESQSVSYNELAKVPANPTKKGHTFARWTPDIATTYIVDDTTFTAQWTANKYTVSFNVVNGEAAAASVEVEYGQKVTAPTVTPAEGYKFDNKWYTDAACTNEYNFDTEVTEGFTLYAKCELKPVPVEYTVSFNAMNGSEITSVKVTENTPVARPAANPTKEGFTFKFWSLDGVAEYDFTKTVTGNMTLVAVWEEDVPVPTTFKVTFDTNGGSAVASVDVKSGEKATKPADPTKTGYKFVGWFANSELTTAYDFNTVVTADITIYAKWEEVKPASDKYIADTAKGIANAIPAEAKDVIKYLLGDGTPSDKKMGCKAEINGTEYSEGLYVDANLREDVDTLEDATKGHLSAFATKDGYASVKIWAVYSKGEAKDVSLTLGKKALDGTKSIICQSDKLNDAKNNKVVLTEPSLMMLDIPVKAGEELIIARNLSASTAVVLRAEFEFYANPLAEKFTVTFDTDGGSEVASQDVKSGEKATKPVDPTKAGYTFTGWTLNGVAYDFDKAVTGNITLKATWVKAEPKTYTVTFDSKGGSPIDSQTVTEGAKATKPADPTLKGYAFTGWTLNDVAYDFNAAVTGNITLVATWSKNPEVTPFPENPESEDDVVVDDYTYTFENVKTYTGVAIKPEVLVKYGDTVLVPGVDYTVSYKNNKNISLYDADKYDKKKCNPTSFDVTNTTELEELVKKAYAKPADKTAKAIVSKLPTIVIKGKGNYAGMNDYLYFNIVDLDVTSVGTTDIKGTLIYNGSAEVQKQNKKGIVFTGDTIDPIELNLVSIKGVNKKANIDKVLEPGVDYVYTIANNVNVGTANIFVKYMGDFVGEGKFTFKIAKADISTIETDYDVEGTKFIDTDYAFKVKGNKPEVTEGISAKLYAGADYKVTYKNNVKVNNYITKEDLEKAVKANNKKLLNTLPTVTVTGGRNYTGKFVIYFNVVAAELEKDVKVYLPTIKYNAAVSTAKPVVFDADGNIVPASNYVFKYYVNVAGEEVELTAKGVDTGMKDAKGKAILAKTNAKLKNFGQLYTEDEINAAKPADQTAMKIENFLNGVYVKVMPKEVKNANPVFTGMSDEYVIHNATNKLTAKAILTKHGKVTYFTEDGKDIFTGEAITLEGTSEDGKANYLTISSLAGEIAYDDCDVIYNNNVNKGTATAYIIPKVNSDNTKIVPGYVTVKFAIKANNLTKTYK